MQIAYDYKIFSGQKYGGISRYITEVARHLVTMEDNYVEIVAPFYINQYLLELSRTESLHTRLKITGRRIRPIPRTVRLRRASNWIRSKIHFTYHRPDIIHETYFHEIPPWPRKLRTVVTVHDMTHEKYPQFIRPGDQTAKLKKLAVYRAQQVICVSENTKQDLLAYYQIPEEKISVIHHGYRNSTHKEVSQSAFEIANQLNTSDRSPYILYVGQRYGYKNFVNVLEAYAQSARLHKDFVLRCFGGGSFDTAEQQKLHSLKLSDKVFQHEGSDIDLAAAYRNASLFVYPSLYEGFGLPLLEAFAYNCLVACADAGSLPEIGQEACVYFDPTDPECIREAMEKCLYGNDQHVLQQNATQRLSDFSWEKCARETYVVYQRAVHG